MIREAVGELSIQRNVGVVGETFVGEMSAGKMSVEEMCVGEISKYSLHSFQSVSLDFRKKISETRLGSNKRDQTIKYVLSLIPFTLLATAMQSSC